MSENENLTTEEPVEELPIEQKKKAINLQDLVYIRQYIDEKFESEVPPLVETTMNDKHYTKTETDEIFSTKTEVNETFYKKTDKVDNAAKADDATLINGVAITQDANGVLKVGDIIIPQEKVIWSPTDGDYLEVLSGLPGNTSKSSITLSTPIKENDDIIISLSFQHSYYEKGSYTAKRPIPSPEEYRLKVRSDGLHISKTFFDGFSSYDYDLLINSIRVDFNDLAEDGYHSIKFSQRSEYRLQKDNGTWSHNINANEYPCCVFKISKVIK